MGTFAGLYGNCKIPEDRKDEFTELVMQLLYHGGMMQFEEIRFQRRQIHVLHPFEFNEKGYAGGYFNYIDDDSWEDIGYNRNTGRFYSSKIGGTAFYETVTAIYILHEIFSDYTCVANVNGRIFSGRPYLAWMNTVLSGSYTNKRALDPLALLEHIHNDNPDCLNYITVKDLLSFTNRGSDSDYYRLMAALHILMGSEDFDAFFEDMDSREQPSEYQFNKKYIQPLKSMGLDALLELCFLNETDKLEKFSSAEGILRSYIFKTMVIHPASIVKSLSEVFEEDFWELWNIWKNRADLYNIAMESNPEPAPVTDTVYTCNMMDTDDSHPSFWHVHRNPSENYHLSDDDLLYYWTPEKDTVQISPHVEQWLYTLKEQLYTIAEKNGAALTYREYWQKLTDLLYECENYYQRIYAFESMYYDFLEHSDLPAYQAAVSLLEAIMQENKEAGSIIEKRTGCWELCDRNITFNPGRMTVKRYLAVMANKELRLKYLGF